jgi:stage II sporulation protein D
MPLPSRVQTLVIGTLRGSLAAVATAAAVSMTGSMANRSAQTVESGFSRILSPVSDAELAALSTRTVALGAAGGGRVEQIPLEVYVARVLSGEGEPNAPEATQQALAIAIRTYTLFNTGRHAREGFDLCDAVHCQVPRAAARDSARSAARATAGRILTYRGAPAEIFYSASCGGRSEVAEAVWPGTSHPYLRARKDDVHDEDMPWMLEMSLAELQAHLERNGFSGTLKNVEVKGRTKSDRVAVLKLSGMQPERIGSYQFRAAIGTTVLRSTAFSVKKRDDLLQFTGRGYGHGVGMCVIGAGRRARRGESVVDILKTYYPGLRIETLVS